MERADQVGLAKNFNCLLFSLSFFSEGRSISPYKSPPKSEIYASDNLLTSSFIFPTLSTSTAPSILSCSRTACPIWNAHIEEALQKTSIASSSTPPPSSIPISGRAARSHSTKDRKSVVHASP